MRDGRRWQAGALSSSCLIAVPEAGGTLITELQYWGQSVRVFGQRLMNEQELIDRLLDPVHDGQLIYL